MTSTSRIWLTYNCSEHSDQSCTCTDVCGIRDHSGLLEGRISLDRQSLYIDNVNTAFNNARIDVHTSYPGSCAMHRLI